MVTFILNLGPFFVARRCVDVAAECGWFCWLRETPGGQKRVCSSGKTRYRELKRWFIKDVNLGLGVNPEASD